MRDVKNHATYVSSWFNLLKTKNHHIHITGFIIITRSDCVFNHYLTHCRRKTNLHRINERKNDLPLKSNEPLEKFCLLTAKTQEDILGCGCRNKMSASVFDDILRMTAIMICILFQISIIPISNIRLFTTSPVFHSYHTKSAVLLHQCQNGYLRRVRYVSDEILAHARSSTELAHSQQFTCNLTQCSG